MCKGEDPGVVVVVVVGRKGWEGRGRGPGVAGGGGAGGFYTVVSGGSDSYYGSSSGNQEQ